MERTRKQPVFLEGTMDSINNNNNNNTFILRLRGSLLIAHTLNLQADEAIATFNHCNVVNLTSDPLNCLHVPIEYKTNLLLFGTLCQYMLFRN